MNPTDKPSRKYFRHNSHAVSVTFDDGVNCRRTLPWSHFGQAVWGYEDPEKLLVEIGEWQVVIHGHNLGALFQEIENAALTQLRAYPEYADDPQREADVFATSIRFISLADDEPKIGRATQLNLPLAGAKS